MYTSVKLFVIVVMCLMFSGCTRYISPRIGALADEQSRISYQGDLEKNMQFKTKDLNLDYVIKEKGDKAQLIGDLSFPASITYSYPIIKSFIMKINWLDESGHVVGVADISPFFRVMNTAPETLKIDREIVVPSGTAAFSFSYYGVFQGQRPEVNEDLTISDFPFNG